MSSGTLASRQRSAAAASAGCDSMVRSANTARRFMPRRVSEADVAHEERRACADGGIVAGGLGRLAAKAVQEPRGVGLVQPRLPRIVDRGAGAPDPQQLLDA